MFRLSASWLVTAAGEVFRDGAVLVGDDGRIVQVGPDPAVPDPEGTRRERHQNGVITPGLVNAHTHLELTGLDDAAPEADFAAWIRSIIAMKAQRSPEAFLDAARRGVRDSLAAGVTTVADTGSSGAVIQALDEEGGRGIAYLEVFGPDPRDAETNLAAFRGQLTELRRFASDRVRLGVSPHAPYSVSGQLYRAAAALARDEGLPLAVHIAESEAESQLLGTASGSFAEAWQRRGIPLPPGGRTPVDWLAEHGVLGRDTLCIHAVRVDAADRERLRTHGCGIAHCPRSNRRHGHGDAPLSALLEAGLRVGVGTDSAASVSPPDLLAEARAARELAGLGAERAFRLATLDAARAIGLEAEAGSLEAGKWGDMVLFRLHASDPERIYEALLSARRDDVAGTWVAGERLR